MASEFVRIPPDSTGKRIRHIDRYDVEINTILIDLSTIEVGTQIIGNTSGITGTYTGTNTKYGEVFIHVTDTTGEFTVGEVLSDVSNGNIGTVVSLLNIYTPSIVMSDGNNPYNTQKIDDKGSSYVRYSEGDLGFDAFGHAQFSQASKVFDWMFTYGDNAEDFYDETIAGGAITGSVVDSSLVLSTPITSGSRITRTSHQYFPYNPGEGNEMLISYRSGDTGTANVVRRWGLFDDEDGLFFELSGSIMSVNVRNSSTGTVIDNTVIQDNWNGDKLENNTIDSYLLDVSKYNIYWIDYQWLGAGKVRFGTFAPDGTHITVHTFKHSNTIINPYMRRGTLPVRLEQFNLDTAATGTDSRMVCCSLLRQSQTADFPGHHFSHTSPTVAVSGSYTPIISAKPKTVHSGETNRITLIPTNFEVYVDGDPIELDVVVNPGLIGANYTVSASNDSAFLVDESATSYVGGTRKDALIFGAGVSQREISETLENTLKLSADGVSQPIFTLAAKSIKSGGNANVTILFRWKESH